MQQLILFELRKLYAKRLVKIALMALLLLSMLLNWSTYHTMYAFDGAHSEGNGKQAVEIDKAIAARYAGPLTDEKVQQMLAEFAPKIDLNGMNAKYLYQNATQSAVFARFADQNGNWNGATVSDVFGAAEIQVGYVLGWLKTSQNMTKLVLALAVVLMVMTAPVFSGEYGGADQIILTCRYGKTKCAFAKAAACYLSAMALTAALTVGQCLLALLLYGKSGLGCSILFAPIEFAEGYIPFPLTCGALLGYQILLAFTGALSVTGITLVLSAVCSKPITAFVAAVALYAIPVLLPVAEKSALFRVIVLLPLYHAQLLSLLSVAQLRCGLLYAVWAIPVALFAMVVGCKLSCTIFAKHEV